MSNAPLCFLDTETTGLHAGRHPWEIAIIRREADGRREVLHVFVEVDLTHADPAGLKVGRFYDRHPLGVCLSTPRRGGIVEAPRSLEAHTTASAVNTATRVRPGEYVTAELAAYLVASWTHGAVVVAANAHFDDDTLTPLLRAHRLLQGWHYRPLCIETAAYGWLTARGHLIDLPWHSREMSRLCLVQPPTEDVDHCALPDAEWVERWFDGIQMA
jgi:hypothetical protein